MKKKKLSIKLIFSEIYFIKKNIFLSRFFLHNWMENQILDIYCGYLKILLIRLIFAEIYFIKKKKNPYFFSIIGWKIKFLIPIVAI